MRGLSSEFRDTLLDGMAERACRLPLHEESFWENAIAALVPRDRLSVHEFAMALGRFNRRLISLPDPRGSQTIGRLIPRPDASLGSQERLLGPDQSPANISKGGRSGRFGKRARSCLSTMARR